MKEKMSPGTMLLVVAGIAAFFVLLSYLSGVLIPFAIAWLVAYMLNPVVNFFQHTCRLRFRVLAVLFTLTLFVMLIVGLFSLVVPPLLKECTNFEVVVRRYYEYRAEHDGSLPASLLDYLGRKVDLRDFMGDDFKEEMRSWIPKLLGLAYSTASALFKIVASLISLLYMFFLMMDYDRYARIWISWIPGKHRIFAKRLMGDIEHYAGGYFRGQFFIALSNCVMFSVGLTLVGFPMPIAMGGFIGMISFVPYLQVAGLVPGTLLALLRSADTGCSFWLLMGGLLLVYIVVQIIQDVLVTPRIMGRIMGLSPAVILLSLSVGGALLGILGLILALPVTTISLLYYRRYILHEEHPTLHNNV